jgi:predicted alpha/beta-hydrolase family hydrolase
VARELRIAVPEADGEVGALLERPRAADCLLALAHGAGAGMRHSFLEALCERLAERGVATLRYQFPYMEQGRRAPSPRPLLLATVRAALAAARRRAGGVPLLAGGKSMGGRMTSLAASEAGLIGVAGIVFVGFPLHPAGKPASERAEHLDRVELPMLFLQGTRDALAELPRMERVCKRLGPRATLHRVAGADHGFHVLKRSGRSDDQVLAELADAVRRFAEAASTSG